MSIHVNLPSFIHSFGFCLDELHLQAREDSDSPNESRPMRCQLFCFWHRGIQPSISVAWPTNSFDMCQHDVNMSICKFDQETFPTQTKCFVNISLWNQKTLDGTSGTAGTWKSTVRLFNTRFHHVKPCSTISTNSCCIRFSKPHPHVTAQSPRDIWHQCDLLAAGTPIALMIHRLALQARSLSECPRPTLNSERSWNAKISALLDPGTSQWK